MADILLSLCEGVAQRGLGPLPPLDLLLQPRVGLWRRLVRAATRRSSVSLASCSSRSRATRSLMSRKDAKCCTNRPSSITGLTNSDTQTSRPCLVRNCKSLGELAPGRHGGGLDARRYAGVGAFAHEEEVVLPQHLLPPVAAQVQEAGVGVDDGVVGDLRVGDRHRHAGGLHRRDEGAAAPSTTRRRRSESAWPSRLRGCWLTGMALLPGRCALVPCRAACHARLWSEHRPGVSAANGARQSGDQPRAPLPSSRVRRWRQRGLRRLRASPRCPASRSPTPMCR